MGYIYKITNQINGKMYIGKTENHDPNERWSEHKHDYIRLRMGKRPLYQAMMKYGIDNFTFEVIDKEEDSNKLCELEKYYIDKYRTYTGFQDCVGYNNTLGGDGKCYLNLNEEEVINIHIKNQYIVGVTANYFNVDSETIKKILKKHDIHWLSCLEIIALRFVQEYGGVLQFDFKMTELLNIYKTPLDVLNTHSNYNQQTLRLACNPNNKTHHAYGYSWYRLSELPDQYKPLLEEYYKTHPNNFQEEKDK